MNEMHVQVSWDSRGYIASAPELKEPIIALSLGGLKRKIACEVSLAGGRGGVDPR